MPPNRSELTITFTPTKDEVIQQCVDRFTILLKSTFHIFLKDNTQLPIWQPPSNLLVDDEFRDLLTRLKIPIIHPESQFPFMLLHKLGQKSHDPQLAGRVDRLFDPNFR
jgi:hypothetical protein